MTHITEYLELLNLSDVETKLYLLLVDSGPTSVRELAVLADMKRTTAYLYVDQLITKGLVMKVIKGSQKMVAAIDPEVSIKHLVDEKLHLAQSLAEKFPSMLERIKHSLPEQKVSEEAEIKYFKGKNGVRKIYEDALKANELRSYFNIELIKEALPDNEQLFTHALLSNPNLKIFELLQDNDSSRKMINRSTAINGDHKGYSFKFLPKNVKLSTADILIYKDHVGIINVGNQFTGLILKNKDYYNNFKELFDLVWNTIPKK